VLVSAALEQGLSKAIPRSGGAITAHKRDMHTSKAKNWAKGPPPDAVHMSSKLVGAEPVQNTQSYLQQSPAETPKMKHGRTSADQAQTPRRKDAYNDM